MGCGNGEIFEIIDRVERFVVLTGFKMIDMHMPGAVREDMLEVFHMRIDR